jgi:hypothetical protein
MSWRDHAHVEQSRACTCGEPFFIAGLSFVVECSIGEVSYTSHDNGS